MMTIKKFFELHAGGVDEDEVAGCDTMLDVWDYVQPDRLLWIATRKGVLDDRILRLFACWCVRQVWHLLTDPRSINAIIVAERYANARVTKQDLAEAEEIARVTTQAIARITTQHSECYSAAAAALYATNKNANRAASYSAWFAAGAAAWYAKDDAIADIAQADQASWLRIYAKPCFRKKVSYDLTNFTDD